MTKEDKKAVTALRKAFPALVHPLVKPYGFKSIGGTIWTVQNEILFTLAPWIATPLGEEGIYFKATCGAKPLFADDLLWDILGFEENKTKPMSLRVNGAFALFSVPVYDQRQPLTAPDSALVTTHTQQALEHFSQFLSGLKGQEMTWFRQWEAQQERYANMEVMRLMLLLHDGKRDEALAYVSSHNVSAYITNGKTVGQLIAEYCL